MPQPQANIDQLRRILSKGWIFHHRTKDSIEIFRKTEPTGVEHYGFFQDGYWFNEVSFFKEEEILKDLIKKFRLLKRMRDNWNENAWRLHEQKS